VVSGLQVELLQLAGGTRFLAFAGSLECWVFVMVAPPQMELPWGAVSVALVEVSLARTGAVGSARTIGVPADTITKFTRQ